MNKFSAAQRKRLWDNSPEIQKDATSFAAFERIVSLTEDAHTGPAEGCDCLAERILYALDKPEVEKAFQAGFVQELRRHQHKRTTTAEIAGFRFALSAAKKLAEGEAS